MSLCELHMFGVHSPSSTCGSPKKNSVNYKTCEERFVRVFVLGFSCQLKDWSFKNGRSLHCCCLCFRLRESKYLHIETKTFFSIGSLTPVVIIIFSLPRACYGGVIYFPFLPPRETNIYFLLKIIVTSSSKKVMRIDEIINLGYCFDVPSNSSNQYLISPYNTNKLSSRRVARLKKTIS